jgi:hypothetical protein
LRAKKINEIKFERGQDPKDALNVGYENARIFNKTVREKDYFAPVLEPMLNGLKEGSIKIKDADDFIFTSIIVYNDKKHLVWYNWFINTSHIFWDENRDELVITFDMPEIDFFQITKDRKIICRMGESETFVHDRHYIINTKLKVTDWDPDSDTHDIDEVFHETNMFYSGDEVFKMPALIHNINKVVETAIKNMD